MTALGVVAYLRKTGRDMTAAELARYFAVPAELIYCELVPAESRGEVRLCAHYPTEGARRIVTWGAI